MKKWTRGDARHLLNRAGFGGTQGEIDRLFSMGREGGVNFLLGGGEAQVELVRPKWATLDEVIRQRKERATSRNEFRKKAKGLSAEEAAKLRREMQRRYARVRRLQRSEAQSWWFQQMLETKSPLVEKMVLFWHDHFPSSIQKVQFPPLLILQNDLFRRFALGSFRDLTKGVVTDPAMLLYLDLQKSSKKQPNENFSRELMELFTLGEGNYSEDDVKEVARAFTGYKLDGKSGGVSLRKFAHDDGEKVIFGERGKFSGMDVVELIFQREECAEFLARKLWVYFCNEKPATEVVKGLAKVLRDADYEVGPVLREIFLSREFYEQRVMGEQIKSPVQYMIQVLKDLEVREAPDGFALLGQNQLGQALFLPPNVAGWDWGKAWVNTNTLLTRYNLAGRLIKGGFGGRKAARKKRFLPDFEKLAAREDRKNAEELVKGLAERFFSVPLPEKAWRSFVEYAEAKEDKEFSDRELGELCHLMMSTPYYQLC